MPWDCLLDNKFKRKPADNVNNVNPKPFWKLKASAFSLLDCATVSPDKVTNGGFTS